MPQHDAYVLHIWRSRAVSGWQWAARLEHLPGGESVRFTAPEALLAHLQALVQRGEHGVPPAGTPAGETLPTKVAEEGGRYEGE
jgi:hypothetical protein